MAAKQRQEARNRLHIDDIHEQLDIYREDNHLTRDIWHAKYRWGTESHPSETHRRVIEGVYAKDRNRQAKRDALEAMNKALWVPGGRIQAGAGTTKVVTMLNCFVASTIQDSMSSIADVLKEAMLTMQQGGGIGMDFCVVPGTKVLMNNGTWKNVEDVQVGEKLVGFDEHATHRMLRVATVEATKTLRRQCFKINTTRGTITSSDQHAFLVRDPRYGNNNPKSVYHWEIAAELQAGMHITFTSEPWEQEQDDDLAWLAGILDGEGSWNAKQGQSRALQTLQIGQNPGPVLDRILGILDEYGIEYHVNTTQSCHKILISNRWEVAKLLSWTQPTRFYHRLDSLWDGRQLRGQKAMILSVEAVGEQEVVATTTSTRTLITNGFASHNSTLRPSGAYLHRTGAVASGPLPFMDMWSSMCDTIMSAGARRGAMMATMHCEHPDLPTFITAKKQKGRLTSFNVSVLVTDAFMDAVANDEEWYLGFGVPRSDGQHLFAMERDDELFQGTWYAYSKHRARDLWDLILKNTYEYSEPGVIFIDRVNEENNLAYCEQIACTNPCGEQPLPPQGCCNLGAVNLARMVSKPFTSEASFDFALLRKVTTIGVRFLDNVIDTTLYPLDGQQREEFAKRRIGLGITGLANALMQLKLTYGSSTGLAMTEKIMSTIRDAAYEASSDLAHERGTFPLYDGRKWGKGSPIVQDLPRRIRQKIAKNGMRNGVLLTIAPTGTTSIFVGNVSSGLEPVFLHKMQRRVRQMDGTHLNYIVYDYGYLMYAKVKGLDPASDHTLPDYMVTHHDLDVKDHLNVQAVCQKYIDASVSKTINCPEDITYDDFKQVYEMAYELGCKGCTTYRPSEVRGSVLSSPSDGKPKDTPRPLRKRPESLRGRTYKIKWPTESESYYLTINDDAEGKPFEVFIQSTSAKYTDWTTALSLMISAIMRRGDDVSFIPHELRKVVSMSDVGWVDGKFYGSLVALFGETIGRHIGINNGVEPEVTQLPPSDKAGPVIVVQHLEKALGDICPECNMPTLIRQEGCKTCHACGFSKC